MIDLEHKPRIAVGADHAGYHVKEAVKKYLEASGYPVDDVGTWSEESVDYPDYARKVADRVVAGQDDFGFLACGTGIGMSIAANKIEARRPRSHRRSGHRNRERFPGHGISRRAAPAAHR